MPLEPAHLIRLTPLSNPRTTVAIECGSCHGHFEVHIATEAYIRWREGEFIQTAAPELGADERELLISGTCGECYDRMFPPETYEPDAGWPNGPNGE